MCKYFKGCNMKNIKYFKYKNTYSFNIFLKEQGYIIEDVKGFAFSSKKQYHGNILKAYLVYFNDGVISCFNVVLFKSLNEYHQSRLGFNGNKLLDWCEYSNIVFYKVKDVWGSNDKYVIAM